MPHDDLPGADESSAADHPADELAAGIDSRGQGSRSAFTWNRPAAAIHESMEIDETGRLVLHRDLTTIGRGRATAVDQLRREYQRLTPVLYSPAQQLIEQFRQENAARAAVVVASPLGNHWSETAAGSAIIGDAQIIANFRSAELERFVPPLFDACEGVFAPAAMIHVPSAGLRHSLDLQHAAACVREDLHCRDVLMKFYDSNQDLLEPAIRSARDAFNLLETRLMREFEPEQDWRRLQEVGLEADLRRMDIQSAERFDHVPVATRRQRASFAAGSQPCYRRSGRLAVPNAVTRPPNRDIAGESRHWNRAKDFGLGANSMMGPPDFIRTYLYGLLLKSDGDPQIFLGNLAELIGVEFIAPALDSEPMGHGAHPAERGPKAESRRLWNCGSGTIAASSNRFDFTPFAPAFGAGGTEIERKPQNDSGRFAVDSVPARAGTAPLSRPKPATSLPVHEEETESCLLRIRDLGEICQVEFGIDSVCVRKSKGVAILKFLVEKPDMEYGVIELWAAASGISPGRTALPGQDTRGLRSRDGHVVAQSVDAAPLNTSDAKARSEYRDALRNISDDIAKAQEFDDQATLRRLSDEREALLACAPPSLGGKEVTRIHSEQEERARKNVCKLIRTALKAIGKEAPDIERHLRGRVRTGYRCQFSGPTTIERRL